MVKYDHQLLARILYRLKTITIRVMKTRTGYPQSPKLFKIRLNISNVSDLIFILYKFIPNIERKNYIASTSSYWLMLYGEADDNQLQIR